MRIRWRTFLIAVSLMAVLSAGVSTAGADDDRHGSHHDYNDHYSFGWGLSLGYPSPYWGGYGPGYGYYGPGYPYGPYGGGYGGSIGLGYSGGGYHDAYSLFFSLPLYFGPRYAPAPAPILVPAQPGAPRQPPAGCLQTREYQTEIVIDGEPVPAYGTACLQADGSWKIISGPFTE